MPVMKKREQVTEPYQFRLPPPGAQNGGRPPCEYKLMLKAEQLIAKLKGQEEALFSYEQFSDLFGVSSSWPYDALQTKRGPKPTIVGKRTIFRGKDIIDWLKFLAKERKLRGRGAAK